MKPWYTSKTLWINFAAIVFGILQVVLQHIVVDPSFLAVGTGIGNFILRFFTKVPILGV